QGNSGAAQFTASFSALPALNAGLLDAGIAIGSLVRGFRPVRAARALTEKEPKPTRLTVSPRLSAAVTDSSTASSARPASALDRPALSATWSINSLLFTGMLDTPCADRSPPCWGPGPLSTGVPATRPGHEDGESESAAFYAEARPNTTATRWIGGSKADLHWS